ncbi:hypothetical protein [Methanobrevibacter thaueri]|uniref:hypothetical protein n=1 Tax=Methanobrevibacter thaueri TaxID=190975 RepID=UPI00350E48AD
MASFLIPGVGQIYAGAIKRGIIFLIITIIFYSIGNFTNDIYQLMAVVVDVIYCLFAAYDAYKLA